MRVLPDPSVWVEYLRVAPPDTTEEMQHLLRDQSIWTCGPVLAEIVKGTPTDEIQEVRVSLMGLPWIELDREAWWEVGVNAGRLRRLGMGLPLTDVVIAVAAVRSGAALWTRDQDFERIRQSLPDLHLHQPV